MLVGVYALRSDTGGGEMSQWLRPCSTLTEDLSSGLSIHIMWLTTSYDLSSRAPTLTSAGTSTQGCMPKLRHTAKSKENEDFLKITA